MCVFCLESPIVKSVPFIVLLGMAASLNRKPASARTSHNGCHAQWHDKKDTLCMVRYIILQILHEHIIYMKAVKLWYIKCGENLKINQIHHPTTHTKLHSSIWEYFKFLTQTCSSLWSVWSIKIKVFCIANRMNIFLFCFGRKGLNILK